MLSSLAQTVMDTYNGPELPPEVTRRFNTLELLAHNDLGETYLIVDIKNGTKFVLKSYPHSKPAHSESEMLKGLEHRGLPRYEPDII